jgi:membrane protein implicated in regulation of membrane protease activity
MEYLTQNNLIVFWIILGIIFVLLDFIKFSFIGILFLGFGAFSTAIAMSFLDIHNYQIQFFGIISLIWFLVFYKQLKRYISSGSKKSEVNDIIGSIVVVVSEIKPNSMGSVKWSGTIMNASLDNSILKSAEVGTLLKVKDVDGNKLICIFKEIEIE